MKKQSIFKKYFIIFFTLYNKRIMVLLTFKQKAFLNIYFTKTKTNKKYIKNIKIKITEKKNTKIIFISSTHEKSPIIYYINNIFIIY